MIFRQFSPCEALKAYVKCYWLLESEELATEAERILPDGCTELIFHYGDKYCRLMENGAVEQPRHLLVGQIRTAIQLQATGRTGMLGIRFQPWGMYPFTGIPGGELTDRHIALDLLFQSLGEVTDHLSFPVDGEQVVARIEAYLLRILKRQKSRLLYDAGRFAGIIPEMLKDISEASVRRASASANMSERQFNRKFNEVTGLSPKHFMRIARMQEFIAGYRQVSNGSALSSLIYDCGYYDPAHFSRDFKAIAGVNPSDYFDSLKELGTAMLL